MVNSSIGLLSVQGEGDAVGQAQGQAGGAAALRSSGATPALDLTTVHILPSGSEFDNLNPNNVTVVSDTDTEIDNSGFFLPLGGGDDQIEGERETGGDSAWWSS